MEDSIDYATDEESIYNEPPLKLLITRGFREILIKRKRAFTGGEMRGVTTVGGWRTNEGE